MRISPTQIASHRQCARRYAWEYGHGHRSPSTPAQERGTRIHAILEDYLNGKGPIDATSEEGAIAQAGIPFLPEPLSGKCEQEFSLVPASKEPFEFFGKIDYVAPTLVIDHKTTSDFKYAKTPEMLREDPQVILYASEGYRQEGYAGQVRYIYYLTAKRKVAQARAVDVTVSRDHVEGKFEALSREAETLYQIRLRKTDPLTLPPSLDACFSYGQPCPHKNRCSDLNTPQDTLKRIMLPGKDDLLARLMSEAGAAPAAAEPPKEKKEEPAKADLPKVEKAPKKKEEKVPPIKIYGVMPILNLYVDCLPVVIDHENTYLADTIFARVREKLAEATQVPHYRMVEYGKGPGLWSEAVREYVTANLQGASVVVDSRSVEGSDALSALSQCAAQVVRGIR